MPSLVVQSCMLMPGMVLDEAHQIGVDLLKSPELTGGGRFECSVSRLLLSSFPSWNRS